MTTSTSTPSATPAEPIHTHVVDFLALDAAQQEDLLLEMLALDAAVFPGATRDDLEPYLRDPRAIRVPVVQYRVQGRLIGQNIIPIRRIQAGPREVAVVDTIAGMLPQYRGSGRMQARGAWEALKFVLRHPMLETWLVTPLMQPRVYEQFVRHADGLFPRPGSTTPASAAQVLEAVALSSAQGERRGADLFVQRALPVPKSTLAERRRLREPTAIQAFFMTHVPDYREGVGLYCAGRVTLRSTTRMIFSATLAALGRRRRRLPRPSQPALEGGLPAGASVSP